MGTIASQITSLTTVYSTVYSGADQRKHQSSASLAFVWGIHRGPVNSPHKWPVIMRKLLPFDDVIMRVMHMHQSSHHSFIYMCPVVSLVPWKLLIIRDRVGLLLIGQQKNKLQWNSIQNTTILFKNENENVVYKISDTQFRLQCINTAQ